MMVIEKEVKKRGRPAKEKRGKTDDTFAILPERQHLYCALEIITTGPNPLVDEIICIKAMLADFTCKPLKMCQPFFSWVMPSRDGVAYSRTESFNYGKIKRVQDGFGDAAYFPYLAKTHELKTAMECGKSKPDVARAFCAWLNKTMGCEPEQTERQESDFVCVPIVENWGCMLPFLYAFFGWETEYLPVIRKYLDLTTVRDLTTLIPFVGELFIEHIHLPNFKNTYGSHFKFFISEHPLVKALDLNSKGRRDRPIHVRSFLGLDITGLKNAPELNLLNPYKGCYTLLKAYRILSNRTVFFSDLGD